MNKEERRKKINKEFDDSVADFTRQANIKRELQELLDIPDNVHLLISHHRDIKHVGVGLVFGSTLSVAPPVTEAIGVIGSLPISDTPLWARQSFSPYWSPRCDQYESTEVGSFLLRLEQSVGRGFDSAQLSGWIHATDERPYDTKIHCSVNLPPPLKLGISIPRFDSETGEPVASVVIPTGLKGDRYKSSDASWRYESFWKTIEDARRDLWD